MLKSKLRNLSCPISTECRICTPRPKQEERLGYLDDLPVAAVLVPLQFDEATNQWRIILTLRQLNMRNQGGDVCFPGGMMDSEDRGLIHTALREAQVSSLFNSVHLLSQVQFLL